VRLCYIVFLHKASFISRLVIQNPVRQSFLHVAYGHGIYTIQKPHLRAEGPPLLPLCKNPCFTPVHTNDHRVRKCDSSPHSYAVFSPVCKPIPKARNECAYLAVVGAYHGWSRPGVNKVLVFFDEMNYRPDFLFLVGIASLWSRKG
jgi:hypothetical protein